MEKRGQFYLVAAIIIAMVVFSLATINSYARIEPRETDVFDLRSEMGLEGGKVIDFALYNKYDSQAVAGFVESWTDVYIQGKEAQEVENWLFVYGNPNLITVLAFTIESSGTITVVDSGGISSSINLETSKKGKRVYSGNYVNITFGNFTYAFNMTADQNFAFLINKEGYIADSRVTGAVASESNEKNK